MYTKQSRLKPVLPVDYFQPNVRSEVVKVTTDMKVPEFLYQKQ